MKRKLILITLLIAAVSAWSQPIQVKTKHSIIIDADCAIDDFRTICILLSRPEINIKAILISDGSMLPNDGIKKVKSLLHEFNRDSIPVAIGSTLSGVNPPWREFNENIIWGRESENRETDLNAEDCLSEILKNTNENYTCLSRTTYKYWSVNKERHNTYIEN
jgi:inosine-uridine nucleoside N-ribohydrolase